MADREQRERESRASDETKFEQERDEQREEVADHADEVKGLPDPEPEQDSQ